MIPKGGKYAKSVVNFVRKAPEHWPKFKEAIKQIDDLLKIGKLKLDGKQKTIFETNKNILKNHEKATKKVELPPSVKKEYPPFNTSKEDPFKGWKPTVHERQNLRNIYKELDPPASKYTKEMEAIDEELNELMLYGNSKYAHLSPAQKEALHSKLQAEMQKLIKVAMKEDLTTLSLSQINKKSQSLQKRIREIADNPNIKGDVHSGPKRDMIKALYDSENPALTKARHIINRKNSELKYGKKYPVLDPENDAFIITGLDDLGNPNKMSRFTGKFSATKDKTTGELTSGEGMSFYDRWNSKTGKLREEGKEVFHETLNNEGKVIMSNPEYKLPKTGNMELQTEFYTDLSTSDLAKKGYELKQIDMIIKGREARKYLEKTKHKDHNIAMHEQTSSNEIGAVMEDLYHRGDDIYKMSMKEWITKIPEHFAGGGSVPGFATGGISNLFRQRYRSGKAVELVTKLPEFLKFVERLLIKASNEIRQGIGKWKGLDDAQKMAQHENLSKLATNFQKTKKFDVRINEYTGIDAEKAFIEARAKVKKNRAANADELDDYIEILDPTGEAGIVNEGMTIKALDKMVAEQKAYERHMFLEYKKGNLDPVAGDKSLARKKFLEKKLEDAELSGDKRLITRDEIEELSSFDLGTEMEKVKSKGKIWKSSEGETQAIAMGFDEKGIKGLDQAMKKGTALSDAMKKMGFNVASANDNVKFDALVSEGMIGFSKEMKEQIIRAKYGDVVGKELLERMLVDTNPQRLSEVMGTIDEGVIMHERGMGTDEIITTLKESFKRKPNVEGGLIPGYATGGVSNLFRSR